MFTSLCVDAQNLVCSLSLEYSRDLLHGFIDICGVLFSNEKNQKGFIHAAARSNLEAIMLS